MPTIPTEDIPKIATTLINLRSETLASISKATGIRTANLSVWLRGREQVISQRRVVELMHHLGMKGFELRTDMIHLWSARGNINAIKQLLGASLDESEKENILIFEDDHVELNATRVIQFDNNQGRGWVVVKLAPNIEANPILNNRVLGFGKVVRTTFPLNQLPTSLDEFKLAVATIYEDARKKLTNTDQLLKSSLEYMLNELVSKLPNANHYRYGLDAEMIGLQAELFRILSNGTTPSEVADKLSKI